MRPTNLLALPALVLLVFPQSVSSPCDADYIALRRMIGQEKYDDAINTCIELIKDHPDYLPLYETLPEVAQYAGNMDKAIAFLEERVEDGTALPFVYYGLGTAFYDKHDYRTAVVYFNNAIESGNTTAECYRGLEYAYEKLEGLDGATRYFNLLCHRDPQNPNNWYGLALAYWTRQDYDRVKSSLSEALARNPGERRYIQAQVATAYLRGETDSVAGMMNKLIGRASEELDFTGKEFLRSFVVIGHFNRDRYQSAIQTIEEVITDSKTYGYLRWLGWGYKRMSDVKFLMGEYQPAISYAKDAASVAEKVGDEELLLASLSRQFEVYSEIGDYYDALETAYCKQAVSQAKGLDREGIRVLGDIAWTLHNLGSDEMALEYAIEALGRSEEFRADLRLLYPLQTILGLIYEGLGNFSEAVRHYSLASSLIPRDDIWRRSMAVSHGQMGRAFLGLKDYREAARHFSLQMKLATAEGYEPEVISALANQGMMWLARKKYRVSREILEESYDRACASNQLSSMLTSSRGLSIVAERVNRLGDAVSWREKAITANESMGLWHEQIMSISGGNRDLIADYHEYVRLLCLLGKPDRALEAAEKAKSISLAKLVSLPQLERSAIASDPQKAHLLQMQKEIMRMHSRIAGSDKPVVPPNSNDSTLGLFSSLNHLEMNFQRLLDSLRSSNTKLYDLLYPSVHSLSEIQHDYLESNQTLIEYSVGENLTAVIVVRKDTITGFTLDVSERSIRELLTRISRVYSDGKVSLPVMNAAIADFNFDQLYEAYNLILRPALQYAGDSKHLTIIPDGALSNLPFEILVYGWEKQANKEASKEPQYVIDKYEINYALSASTELNLRRQARRATKLILAIGDPVVTEKTNVSVEVHKTSMIGPSDSDRPRVFPGVRRELGAIRNIFGNAATVLARLKATSRLLKNA